VTVRAIVARRDEGLGARIVRHVPLLYRQGADAALDRPAHVRAASGLAWIGDALAVIQDDANFVALADPATGLADVVTLPAGEGGMRQFGAERGNKRFKLDLEGCTAVLDGSGGMTLVAFGSGSAAGRDRILRVDGIRGGEPSVDLRGAPAFYALLRRTHDFAGGELNVEGAAWRGGRIVLLNRGNGAAVDDRAAVDAICEVGWADLRAHLEDADRHPPPAPSSIRQYNLGTIGGCRLAFTDAVAVGDALVYTATAEDSPNAVDDGPVAGSAIGIIRADGEARWTELLGEDGGRFDSKVEGVARGLRPGTLYVVVDRDDPHRPSELCEVELGGDWPRW
jgi:hypothetical protein